MSPTGANFAPPIIVENYTIHINFESLRKTQDKLLEIITVDREVVK